MDKENRTAGELLQEKLCINRRNIGLTATDGEEAAAQAFCEPYKQFLDACKTEREAVTYIVARAQAAGYKPFDPKEIVARIKAIMRRTGKTAAEADVKEVSYDKLVVNMTKYELKVDGKVIDTPPKELELLYHLASNPNRVYTRDQLLDEVWGFEYYGDSRTIDVHVKRLREKLAGASDKWELKTVWGVGYKFEVRQ